MKETTIEKNKLFFEQKVYDSLKYISEPLGIDFIEKSKTNFNWKVFANYFLCIDAIREKNQKKAEHYLTNALNHLPDQHCDPINPQEPEVLILNHVTITSDIGKMLKDIYDKPDNAINDDGIYAFGPFLGDDREEINKINQSLKVMRGISDYFYHFVTSLIHQVVLVGVTDRGSIKSSSAIKTLGCIIMCPNTEKQKGTLNQYIEDFIHESSHIELFLEQAKDQLVNNPAEYLYAAPFREDKRPMAGIYHANYVLGNIVSYFSQAVKSSTGDILKNNDYFLKRALSTYLETYNIVEKQGDLTKRGHELFRGMREKVA
jgi:hypothetical protein